MNPAKIDNEIKYQFVAGVDLTIITAKITVLTLTQKQSTKNTFLKPRFLLGITFTVPFS